VREEKTEGGEVREEKTEGAKATVSGGRFVDAAS
jgi:hypothetical protein